MKKAWILPALLLAACANPPPTPPAGAPAPAAVDAGPSPAPTDAGAMTYPVADAGETGLWRPAQPMPAELQVAGVEPRYERCLENGWCQTNWPAHVALAALGGTGERDLWAVGELGAALHWDGARWTATPTPTTESLSAVWAAAPDDVWTAGAHGALLHWDGYAWSRLESSTTADLASITGTGPRDVWIAGYGVALHWDGQALAPSPGFGVPLPPRDYFPNRPKVLGFGPRLAFGLSEGGCQSWDGSRWSEVACSLIGAHDVWGSSPDDIWAVGSTSHAGAGQTFRSHWDGTAWTTETLPYNSDMPNTEALTRVIGFGRFDVWINGHLHYDGTAWSDLGRAPGYYTQDVWGVGGKLFQATMHAVSRRDPTGWTTLLDTFDSAWLTAAGGAGPGAWATSRTGSVFRFDGRTWSPLGGGVQAPDFRVEGGSGPTDLWAYDNVQLLHWDGAAWRPSLAVGQVTAFTAPAPGRALAALQLPDQSLHLMSWDGARWSDLGWPFGANGISSLSSTSPSDIWAAGGDFSHAAAFHWDGASWTRIYTGSNQTFLQLLAVAGGVWALVQDTASGFEARILRWNGSHFTRAVDANANHLTGADDDLWANVISPTGGLLHFDGSAWSLLPPLPYDTVPVAALPGGPDLAFRGGAIFVHRP